MKRLLLFLIFIALLSSCSHGLNKPIIGPLTVDDLRSNMKDTTFTDFYSRIQKISAWILADDVKQAKYGKISYKQIKKYEDFGNDTTFFNKKILYGKMNMMESILITIDLGFLREFPVPMHKCEDMLALCDPGNIPGSAV